MNLQRIQAITFDCYGTLIDWETGILEAVQPVLRSHGVELAAPELLSRYAAAEAGAEAGEYVTYREVLKHVARTIFTSAGFEPDAAETEAIVNSIGTWKAFPDTVAALKELHRRFNLGIISNVDDDLFAQTAPHLSEGIDCVVTAEQLKCYKPNPLNFLTAIQRLDVPRERLLHVAQSRYHDIAPARRLGIATVWINRKSAHGAGSAVPSSDAVADLELPDLKALVEKVRQTPKR